MNSNTEPVLTAAGITGVVMAVLNVPVVMGWVTLDATQLAAINAAVLSVVGLVFAIWARNRVTPL